MRGDAPSLKERPADSVHVDRVSPLAEVEWTRYEFDFVRRVEIEVHLANRRDHV